VHAEVTVTAAAETVTTTRRLGRLSRKRSKEQENMRGCARGDDEGGTCKNFFLAWLDGRHHQRHLRRRGGGHDASPSARRPGHPQMSGEGRSSLWWPLAEVKASVMRRGTARLHGRGRQRRRGCRRRGCARRQRVRLLLTSGSGLRGSSGGGVPSDESTSFTSSPPSTSPTV
jgi:hypothetical protein